MKKEMKGALIGGIVGGLIGILLGFFVLIGISISVPHSGTVGVSLIGFLITLFITIFLGLIFGYSFIRYKAFAIIGTIGIILQILLLLFTYNLNTQNKILYWILYPGLILIVFIIIGIIVQKLKNKNAL